MIDIRYINEQNKLKLLDQINKLQKELQKYQNLESSCESSINLNEGSTTEKFIASMNQLNNKINELKNPEPIYI